MGTITLPNFRATADVRMDTKLKDGGVYIEWSSLTDIKAWIYSDAQKALAGRVDVSVDEDDATVLKCLYSASKPQYLGINRLVVQARYDGCLKTYDKPVFNFVARTAEATGALTIDDPEVAVEIEVEDVSSSILQEAIEAALSAAEDANDAADLATAKAAEAQAAIEQAALDHTRAGEDHARATGDHETAAGDHTTAAADHTQAAADHTTAAADHTQAGADHTAAASDHTRAESDHSAAASDHTRAGADHTTAAADHTTASSDHTTAGADHTQAASDHTQAASDHTTAAADHAQAVEDHDAIASKASIADLQSGELVPLMSEKLTPGSTSTDISADGASDAKYTTPKAVKTYTDGKVGQLGQEVHGDSATGTINVTAGSNHSGDSDRLLISVPQGVTLKLNLTAGTATMSNFREIRIYVKYGESSSSVDLGKFDFTNEVSFVAANNITSLGLQIAGARIATSGTLLLTAHYEGQKQKIADLYEKCTKIGKDIIIPIDECVHGSIQGSGIIATNYKYCLTTPFIKVFEGNKVFFKETKMTYNNVEYTVRIRVVGMQDKDNTGASMLSNDSALCPKELTIPTSDRYIRLSFYFYYLSGSTWTQIDSSVDALTAFAGKCVIIRNDIVDEIVSRDLVDNAVDDNKAVGDILLPQFKKDIYSDIGVLQSDKPLVLLHFSDLHGGSNNLGRLIEYYKHYEDYIDDVLFTGDLVGNQYSDSISYWADKGADNVLFVMGNHDTATYSGGTYSWLDHIGTDAYNKFIAPNISGWGVTQPADAAANGLCYYYKDYSPNIRLIVVDDMSMQKDGGDAAQVAWFEAVLADAKTNSKCVIVAAHYPSNMDVIQCPFSGIKGSGNINTYSARASLTSAVDSFITGGGKFIAWLTGHLHRDMLGSVSGATNKQLTVGISTASCNSGQIKHDAIQRAAGTKSADLFNIIKVDTYKKVLTIYRVGSDFDTYGRKIETLTVDYENCTLLV